MQYINLRGHFNRKQSVFTTDQYLGYIIISWETLICKYHHSFPKASWPLGSISIAKLWPKGQISKVLGLRSIGSRSQVQGQGSRSKIKGLLVGIQGLISKVQGPGAKVLVLKPKVQF